MKRIAIMQPYFLPYLGYWQLIQSVDKFIIFDDVNFIRKGWIHKNFISLGGRKHQINICLKKASINKRINEHKISEDHGWKETLFAQIRHSRTKKCLFSEHKETIGRIIFHQHDSLNVYLLNSISIICDLLDIETEIVVSSAAYENDHLKGEERIIDICKKENATEYVNLPGGKAFYSLENFDSESIKLSFLTTAPGLSIVDNLLNVEREEIIQSLKSIKLVNDNTR
tara:strand:- start:13262 stop:13942 length:681 start_codon:yes stop_codon:yes gene_type:complete